MADYETRPLSIYRNGEWRPSINGHTTEAGPSSVRQSRISMSGVTVTSRRRSSATTAPPAGPPPSQPIPRLPIVSEAQPYGQYDQDDVFISSNQDNDYDAADAMGSPVFNLSPFQRPTASSQLAAVARFSQARLAAASSPPPSNVNLSDSPPRSILPRSSRSSNPPDAPHPPSQEIVPSRLLLSPTDPPDPSEPRNSSNHGRNRGRPSSRRALTRALELAREAVRLDSTNDDPQAAIQAYGQSVALLNEVMEGVMKGDNSDRRRNGRRRSIVAQEEEVRRLKSIHDTYADRMNILSLIYSIPVNPQLSSSAQPSRPNTPELEGRHELQMDITRNDVDVSERSSRDGLITRQRADSSSPLSTSSDALVTSGRNSTDRNDQSEAAANVDLSRTTSVSSLRSGSTGTRLRASSNLPPRPPAPSNSPPSTPTIVEPPVPAEKSSPPSPRRPTTSTEGLKPRGTSITHRRTGSGNRVEALREEEGVTPLRHQQHQYDGENDSRRMAATNASSSRVGSRESPPLPALPSPSNSEAGSSVTPRGMVTSDRQPSDTAYPSSRPRGSSTLSTRTNPSENQPFVPLINDSPMMGTISQRRNKSSTVSTILENSADGGEGRLPKRLAGSSLPSNISSALSAQNFSGRGRAASQPIRPSGGSISGLPTEVGNRPTFVSSTLYAPPPRKDSSGFRQSPQPPHAPPTSYLSSVPPSSYAGPALTLVPPPPVLPSQVPTTPTSPLPPMPPTDPLRKPYHLMTLLRHTMISKSGGYITRKLHVPYEVWSQGGAKLANLPEKVRVVEVLCEALSEVQNASNEFCGPMGAASGMGLGVGSITRKDGEVWVAKLDEFLSVCDNVVSSFGKKLSVGEGFVLKKNTGVGSWGGKLTRQLDKLTNGKNLDSPMTYVQGLQKLFSLAQLLDDHTKALNSQPIAPAYGSLATDLRLTLELKLKRSSEFFASVVLTFVIRDLSQLLDKYAKKGEKWLAE